MSIPARTGAGETYQLVAYDGRELTLVSERALAPGNPISVQVDVGVGFALELKSLGSVRRPEGGFTVRARPTTLSRHAREALAKAFALSPP